MQQRRGRWIYYYVGKLSLSGSTERSEDSKFTDIFVRKGAERDVFLSIFTKSDVVSKYLMF